MDLRGEDPLEGWTPVAGGERGKDPEGWTTVVRWTSDSRGLRGWRGGLLWLEGREHVQNV